MYHTHALSLCWEVHAQPTSGSRHLTITHALPHGLERPSQYFFRLSVNSMDTLCLHCSALFVEHPPSLSSTKHHETAGALIESAQHCTLCRTIQEYWSLGYLQRRFPELEGPGADSLPLKIEVESSGRCESADVVWFVLVGEIDVTKHKFSAGFSLTVTRHVKTSKFLHSPVIFAISHMLVPSLWCSRRRTRMERRAIFL